MGRAPCCDKANVKKGPWSPEEDVKLKEYIQKHGTGGNWIALPQKAGLKRCGKSCRLRWLNYLRPDIKHGDFSDEEDRVILNLFTTIGSRWSVIAAQLAGRTDNDIKNYWNTKLKKKFIEMASATSHRTPQQYSSTTLLSEKFPPILEPSSVISSSSPASNYYNTHTPPSTFITSSYEQKPSLVNRATCFSNLTSPSGLETYNQNIHSMNQFQENFMRFGGEASSSSDDGSSSTNQIGCNKETEHDLDVDLQGFLCSYGVMDHHVYQKSYGYYYGGNQLDYSLEEIKQLISSNHDLQQQYHYLV